MLSCQSCGMPMDRVEDHGGGSPQSLYCKYCADTQGKLLQKEVVREKMISFQMRSSGKTREQIEPAIDTFMMTMAAWRLRVTEPANASSSTDRIAETIVADFHPSTSETKPFSGGVLRASQSPSPATPFIEATNQAKSPVPSSLSPVTGTSTGVVSQRPTLPFSPANNSAMRVSPSGSIQVKPAAGLPAAPRLIVEEVKREAPPPTKLPGSDSR